MDSPRAGTCGGCQLFARPASPLLLFAPRKPYAAAPPWLRGPRPVWGPTAAGPLRDSASAAAVGRPASALRRPRAGPADDAGPAGANDAGRPAASARRGDPPGAAAAAESGWWRAGKRRQPPTPPPLHAGGHLDREDSAGVWRPLRGQEQVGGGGGGGDKCARGLAAPRPPNARCSLRGPPGTR